MFKVTSTTIKRDVAALNSNKHAFQLTLTLRLLLAERTLEPEEGAESEEDVERDKDTKGLVACDKVHLKLLQYLRAWVTTWSKVHSDQPPLL